MKPHSEVGKPVDGGDTDKTRAVRSGRKTGKSTRSVPLSQPFAAIVGHGDVCPTQ